jgi:hypothetical protein
LIQINLKDHCNRRSADAGFATPSVLDMSSLDTAARVSRHCDEVVLVVPLIRRSASR